VRYAWILEQSADYGVRLLCSVMRVSCSAYYAWAVAGESEKAKGDKALTALITAAFTQNRAVYGTRRLKKVLQNQGEMVSRRRIGRIMQEAQLRCKTKRRFKATTDSKHTLPIAPNPLDRQFKVDTPNQVYTGDITVFQRQRAGYTWPS
jgi:putative transposase